MRTKYQFYNCLFRDYLFNYYPLFPELASRKYMDVLFEFIWWF